MANRPLFLPMMRIDQLTPPTREGGAWSALCSDGTTLQVHESDLVAFGLYTGMELSQDVFYELQAAAELGIVRTRACRILTARPLSYATLSQKLCEKGASIAQATAVCDWAVQIGLLDEVAYSKIVVRHYAQKGYGFYKIKDELYRHGVPRTLWEDALTELASPDQAIDRYLNTHLNSKEPKAVQKNANALSRRGFAWSDISDGIARREKLISEDMLF